MSGPRIAMIGAGSVVFARALTSDILSFPELANAQIRLHDIDRRRLETAEMMVRSVAKTLGANPTIVSSLDRKAALRDADYVINSIQVGGHDATLRDFDIPKKYGLRQTIADTLGIGGIFRALRTIPVMLDICADMRAECPDALLLNYTNPMVMLCLAVERFGGVPVVGLCHSVQHTARVLADFAGVARDDVWYRVAGINHMSWFLDFRRRNGEDLYPRLWEALDDPARFGKDAVRFEMMRRLGYFVTESSEHMSEYLPYFIKRQSEVDRLNIPIDEYIRRSERNLNRAEEERARLDRGEAVEVKKSDEFAAYIIHSIVANKDWSFHGNVLNRGLIDNLPSDTVVEVPILVNAAGLQPCHVGALPPQLAGLNRTNIATQQLVVEAAVTGNRDHVYHAAMLDPHTSSMLTLDEIWHMVDDLIDAHGSLLPRMTSKRLQTFVPAAAR
ncbi:MAG: alpha-glucosidase/alpha-galactosidase [Chloroflexota bacterium]|nr:MAG: alpha-glucosidase/alpha-galactosidase [Chloroflexota bacterium]